MAMIAALMLLASGCSRVGDAVPCAPPVVPPDRDLSQREVWGLWSEDRLSLIACGGANGWAD